jgi:hypothetical protein
MGRVIALLFHVHGTRRGWVVSVTPRSYFTPGKDSVPIVQEAGWAPGPVWTGAEKLAPTGIRSSDRPARSSVAIPTELPGPPHNIYFLEFKVGKEKHKPSNINHYIMSRKYLSICTVNVCKNILLFETDYTVTNIGINFHCTESICLGYLQSTSVSNINNESNKIWKFIFINTNISRRTKYIKWLKESHMQ